MPHKKRRRAQNEKEKERRRIKSNLRVTMFKSNMEREQLRTGMLLRNDVLQSMGFAVSESEQILNNDVRERISAPSVITSYPERSPSPEKFPLPPWPGKAIQSVPKTISKHWTQEHHCRRDIGAHHHILARNQASSRRAKAICDMHIGK
jgi:hypothetical protein